MRVSVAYARPGHQHWLKLDLPEGATVRDAIAKSGLLLRCPEIDISDQKVGIFGKVTTLDTTLTDGDRVELYRPITADPKLLLDDDEAT